MPRPAITWMYLAFMIGYVPPAAANDAAIAAGVGAGIAASQANSTFTPLVGSELQDWKDPRTGTTTRLFHQCGHIVEARLTGSSVMNFLTLTIVNASHYTSALSPTDALATFGSGRTRRLEVMSGADIRLARDWWTQWVLRFPRKEDFEGQSRITVTVPLQLGAARRCTIEAVLERSPEVPPAARTFTEYTAAEVYVAFGARLSAIGGQRALGGGSGPLVAVGGGGFPSIHHGFFIELGGGVHGSDGVNALADHMNVGDTDRLGAIALWGGYVFRPFVSRRFALNYGLGVGAYIISLSDNDPSTQSTEVVYLGLQQRLRLDIGLGRIWDGTWFGLAPAVQHIFIPEGSFGPVRASGHGFGVTGAIVVAY